MTWPNWTPSGTGGRWGSGLGRGFSDAEIAELIRLDRASWLRLQAGTVALIEDLAARRAAARAAVERARRRWPTRSRGLPMAAHFGHLIFSCQLKLAKPDPECLPRALARLGASADDVIFIDDRAENVAAAAALGLRSVHFTSPDGIARGRRRAAGRPRLNAAGPGRHRPAWPAARRAAPGMGGRRAARGGRNAG